MKRILRLALGGAVLAGAMGLLCATNALAWDGSGVPAVAATTEADQAVPAAEPPAATPSAEASPAGRTSAHDERAAISPPAQAQSPATSEPATPPNGIAPSESHAPGASKGNGLTPGQIAVRSDNEAALRNPLNWAVTVYKSRHRLVVYYKGHLYKVYDAVFGRSLDHGTKLWAGDRRTPEGVYTIVGKHPSPRWRYFLKLDYPNNVDRENYEELVSEGEVPRLHGHVIPEGGAIGIHGTDEPILNEGNVNWTTGCISVENGAIDELDALLPVGTVVIIKP